MRNEFWDCVCEMAERLTYTDYMKVVFTNLQFNGYSVEKVWIEGEIVFLKMYDTTLVKEDFVAAIFSEKYKDFSEEELKKMVTIYGNVEVYAFSNLDEKAGAVAGLYDIIDIGRVPSSLWDLKKECDRRLKPILKKTMLRNSNEADHSGVWILFARDVKRMYEWCNENNDLDYFRLYYLYSKESEVKIEDIDSIRGDEDTQMMLSKAIKYLVEGGTSVTLKLWAMDSGFELLKGELEGLISTGSITVKYKALLNKGINIEKSGNENIYKKRLVAEKEIDSMKKLNDLVDLEKVLVLSGCTFQGVKTGFENLDALTGGLADGEVIVLGGRPAMGKTSFACALVDEIGINQKECVLYFSLDMPSEHLTRKLIAQHADVNIAPNNANNEKFRTAVHSAVADMRENYIYIDDTQTTSVDDIREKCLELYRKRNIRLVIIDYLQLIREKGFDSRHDEIEHIMTELKKTALELGCPVFVLSQLNRTPELRADHRPLLCDLRGTGMIENMADEVMLLYRDEYYYDDSEYKGNAEVRIFKCSRAPVSTAFIKYDWGKGQFRS